MLQPRLRLVSSSRLVNTDDEEWMERENKCPDCCPVVGCETCGQCEQHPVTDAGIAEYATKRAAKGEEIMHATTIVGYTFNYCQYHPECLRDTLLEAGYLAPAARDMSASNALWHYVNANALEEGDTDYPTPIFYSPDLAGEVCDRCSEPWYPED